MGGEVGGEERVQEEVEVEEVLQEEAERGISGRVMVQVLERERLGKVQRDERKRKKKLTNKGMWGTLRRKGVERGRLLCFPEEFQNLEEKRKKRLTSCS